MFVKVILQLPLQVWDLCIYLFVLVISYYVITICYVLGKHLLTGSEIAGISVAVGLIFIIAILFIVLIILRQKHLWVVILSCKTSGIILTCSHLWFAFHLNCCNTLELQTRLTTILWYTKQYAVILTQHITIYTKRKLWSKS